MKSRILLSFFLICCVVSAHGQVTSNVFTRVLELRSKDQIGSGFTLDIDGRQYLVTAKHIVAKLKGQDSIDVFAGNQWSKVDVKVLRCEDPVDIAVLVPNRLLTPSYTLETVSSAHQLIVGQDAYFLGFPYGIAMQQWSNLNSQHPFAFTGKASVSATVHQGGAEVLLLDGRNNPGFSGGPVVFRDTLQSQPIFYVVGVISGFRPELVPVTEPVVATSPKQLKGVEPWRIKKRKDGKTVILKDTERLVPQNSGIVIAFHIQPAIEIIKQHPIGPEVGKQ